MKHGANRLLVVALPLLVVGFGWGLATLFELRFASGDLYPAYSTLRADPMGSKALFDGLADVRGIEARRFYGLPDHIGDGRDTTLFVIGASVGAPEFVDPAEAKELEDFVRGGGRLVMSFRPIMTSPGAFRRELMELGENAFDPANQGKKKDSAAKRKPGKSPPPKPAKQDANVDESAEKSDAKSGEKSEARKRPPRRRSLLGDERRLRAVSLYERWGFKRAFRDLPESADRDPESVNVTRKDAPPDFPPLLTWHTAVHFKELTNAWRVLYARDADPVLIERPLGKGTVVVCADAWPFSNEALRSERRPALLAWFAGANRVMLFDETHHGIEAHPGVAAMLRRYNLHGLLGALLLLALLHIWRNAVHFVPPLHEETAGGAGAVLGKDSASGFVNLLRRSIPRVELIHTCFAEWKKSCGHQPKNQRRAAEMQGALDSGFAKIGGTAHPVDAYRELSRIATEQK
ncbi:MAG: DUF4350 domain-containing protein [Verrucomicrobia bacterium]|nr:DUF4350 domain-containing protein [Verrucomicrobiota bacterium]